VFHTDLHLLARVAIGMAVAFAFGFERQLRGSPAGNRTFALVGGTAAGVTAVAGTTSPQAIAGILTGIGFLGAGLVFIHGATVRGLTSASTVFAVAGIGIVFGYGHLFLGLFMAAAMMFLLELQHIPGLRALDASAIASRFANDFDKPTPTLIDPPTPEETGGAGRVGGVGGSSGAGGTGGAGGVDGSGLDESAPPSI
jgi:putative Mg2+ transporter-C (MgtC) family protein